MELRAEFDRNKHVDMDTARKLLEEGEERYKRNIHPDPYICEPEGLNIVLADNLQ